MPTKARQQGKNKGLRTRSAGAGDAGKSKLRAQLEIHDSEPCLQRRQGKNKGLATEQQGKNTTKLGKKKGL